MSYVIANSDSPDDIWMLSNSLFRWFANLFNTKFAGDQDLLNQMDVTLAIQGVSLDLLSKEDALLEAKFRQALRSVAAEIVGGHHVICYDDGSPHPDQSRACDAFVKLIAVLDRSKP